MTAKSAKGAQSSATPAVAAKASTPRLHHRLKQLGNTAFPEITSPDLAEHQVSSVEGVTAEARDASDSSTAKTEPLVVARRHLRPTRVGSRPAASKPAVTGAANENTDPKPSVAEPQPAELSPASQPDASLPADSQSVSTGPEAGASSDAQADVEETTSVVSASAEPPVGGNLLFTRQSPVLAVETVGPRQITVGKESKYEVTIRNSGQVAADQVVVTIDLPEWAEVLGTEVGQGTTRPPSGSVNGGLQWELGQLAVAEQDTLILRIVPRQSQRFDLGVKWDCTPVESRARIEVQEPKLEMRLDGPSEVLYGQSEVYRLEIVNTGTGDAENVEISLVPIGTGENVAATHKLGTVEAGEKKSLEVELTARQTGTLTIKIDARGDAGVEAHLAEQIAVHRPELKLDVEAPELQYVGTALTYEVRVSNSGTAPAKNVVVTTKIPPAMEYVSCSAGGNVSPDRTGVTWTLDSLDVAAEKTFQLTCKLARAGSSRLEAASTAADGLTASGKATVKVEAIADLELDVTDPPGPVPVGAEATYQVRVRNRGTKGAEQVEVVAYFSNGIEPISVEGGQHQTAPGQVLFDQIPSLAAGEDLTFQIKAKAGTPGNHICRVEVYCKPLGTRLVSEETTYFYGGADTPRSGSRPESADETSTAQNPAIRTADQRPATAPPQTK